MPIVTDSPRHCSTQNYTVIPPDAIVHPEIAKEFNCSFAYHANLPGLQYSGGGQFLPRVPSIRGTAPITLTKDRSSVLFNGSIAVDFARQPYLEYKNGDVFSVLVKAKPYATGGQQVFIGNLNASAGVNNGWAVGMYGSNLGWACIQNDGSSDALQDTALGFYTNEINNFGYVIDTNYTDLSMITAIVNGFIPQNLPVGFSTATLGSPTYGASNTLSVGGLYGLGSKYLSGTYLYEMFVFKTRLTSEMFWLYEMKPEDFWWWAGKNPTYIMIPPINCNISLTKIATVSRIVQAQKIVRTNPVTTPRLYKQFYKTLTRSVTKALNFTAFNQYNRTLTLPVTSTLAFTSHAVKLVNILQTVSSALSLKQDVSTTFRFQPTTTPFLFKKWSVQRKIVVNNTVIKKLFIRKSVNIFVVNVSSGITRRIKVGIGRRIQPTTTITKTALRRLKRTLTLHPTKTVRLIKQGQFTRRVSAHSTLRKILQVRLIRLKLVSKTLSLRKRVQPILRKVVSKTLSLVKRVNKRRTLSVTKTLSLRKAVSIHRQPYKSRAIVRLSRAVAYKRTLLVVSNHGIRLTKRRFVTRLVHPTVTPTLTKLRRLKRTLLFTPSKTLSITKRRFKTLIVSAHGTPTLTKHFQKVLRLTLAKHPTVSLSRRLALKRTILFRHQGVPRVSAYRRLSRTLIRRVTVTPTLTQFKIKFVTLLVHVSNSLHFRKSIHKTLLKGITSTLHFSRTKIRFVTIHLTKSPTVTKRLQIGKRVTVHSTGHLTLRKLVSKIFLMVKHPSLVVKKTRLLTLTVSVPTTLHSRQFKMPVFIRKIFGRIGGDFMAGR